MPNYMTPAGVANVLNISAATVVKASAGYTTMVTVSGVGTAGALTLNDCTTTGAAAAANQVVSIPYGAFTGTASIILPLSFVFTTGITISAVPTGVTVAVSYA
jgi:hypothetical protein